MYLFFGNYDYLRSRMCIVHLENIIFNLFQKSKNLCMKLLYILDHLGHKHYIKLKYYLIKLLDSSLLTFIIIGINDWKKQLFFKNIDLKFLMIRKHK